MHDDDGGRTDRDRRGFIAGAAGLLGLGLTLGLVPFGRGWRAAAQTRGAPAGPSTAPQQPRGTRLVLLGTRGGPGIDLRRGQTASAVVVDGTPYLLDCGYGTVRALVASGLGLQGIGTVLLTHLHNDHTADVAALLSFQWTGSRPGPTDVYGPYGTQALVEAALAFFKADAEIRTVDEGRTTPPASQFHGHDLEATTAPAAAFKDERVTVTSVENTHYPERSKARMAHRALAYRFETAERSIVFSGDTAYSSNLVALARGADLFVCEIMDQGVHDRMEARAKAEAEAGHPDNVSRHVAETHSTPADVGRMAAEAQVKTVVLNHLLPGRRTPEGLDFPVSTFVEGVRKAFAGEIIVGEDLMVL